jgi:thiol-disulfide isomerase/thioredoxin
MKAISKSTIVAILTLLLFFDLTSYSQTKITKSKKQTTTQSFLRVGDKIPDRYFAVNNYLNKQIKISELDADLILLDMWGTYCVSCIDHMPEIEALQKYFKDSIQVLMVTKNSDVEVKKCAIRAENVRNNTLPFINGKENLAAYFNLSFVPQYVWIDKQGVIKYITEESGVSRNNISKFLAGDILSFKQKTIIPDPNGTDPLLVQMYPYLGKEFFINSYLAPLDLNRYTTGSLEGYGLDMPNAKSVSGNSFSFKSLYKVAYGYSDFEQTLSNDRVLINFNDTAIYADPAKAYIYEIQVNKNVSKKRVLKHIQSELDLFFNVNSFMEKRSVQCLVLNKLDNGHTYYTTKTDTNRYDKVGNKLLKVTLPWGKFLKWTNGMRIIPPYTIIDETGIDDKAVVDFQLSLNFENMDEVQRSLAPYGLTMTLEQRQLDCIVINDVK